MTVQAKAAPLPNKALNGLSDQIVTKIVRIRNGDQALNTVPSSWLCAFMVTSWPAKRKMRFGFQTLRKAARQIKLTRADVMSGSSGPTKLAVKNWVTAKLTPVTRMAGQVSRTPRQPSMIMMTQNGIKTDRNGN